MIAAFSFASWPWTVWVSVVAAGVSCPCMTVTSVTLCTLAQFDAYKAAAPDQLMHCVRQQDVPWTNLIAAL